MPAEAPTFLSAHTGSSSVQLTSALLRAELLEPYAREVWERFVHHENLGETNPFSIRAIARAMSAHQHATYGLEVSPQHYKDRVSRAISGEHISTETLELFCETFDFDEKTVKALQQAMIQGFDHSETVQFLRSTPQAVISSAFFNLAPGADSSHLELQATVTYLSLDSGCSAVLFYLPGSSDAICQTETFGVTPSKEDGEWLFTPLSFIAPLQAFALRFTLQLEVQRQEDGSSSVEIPFPGRSYATGIRFATGGREMDLTFQERRVGTSAQPQAEIMTAVRESASQFYPLLSQSSVTISWSDTGAYS